MYTRLNHVSVALSYTGTLKVIDEVSALHTVPLKQWIASNVPIKFVSDNFNRKRDVCDIRSDHNSTMLNMYSMLVVRSRAASTTDSSSREHHVVCG